MSEVLKDATADELDTKDDVNVQYTSWQEAIGAIRLELLNKIRDEVNQSLDKGLGAMLTTWNRSLLRIYLPLLFRKMMKLSPGWKHRSMMLVNLWEGMLPEL